MTAPFPIPHSALNRLIMHPLRKSWGVISVVAALLALLPATYRVTAAADTSEAFVINLGKEAVDVLKATDMTETQRIEQMRTLFVTYFDVPEIAKFVAGRHWRGLSDAQRSEYLGLFEDYIVYVYSRHLGGYGGESLKVKNSSPKPGGTDETLVVSEIVSPNTNKSYQVNWDVEGQDGGYKITDIVVEGVSMKQQQRSDFGALVQQSGGRFEGLLKALREKNAQLKAEREQAS